MSNKSPILKRDSEGKLFTYDITYEKTKAKLSTTQTNDNYVKFLASKQIESDFRWHLIKVAAAAIASDGEHQQEELLVCEEICNELGIEWDQFQVDLENELASIASHSLDAITAYLKLAFPDSQVNNSFLLFEAALHLILADGIMTQDECNLLADIGTILNIPTGKIIARIGLFLKEEKQTLVDVAESLKWQATMYITE